MNFSFSEIVLILLIALLVVKPEQLPGVAHSLGRFVKTIRGMFDKVKDEMNDLLEVDQVDKKKREQKP